MVLFISIQNQASIQVVFLLLGGFLVKKSSSECHSFGNVPVWGSIVPLICPPALISPLICLCLLMFLLFSSSPEDMLTDFRGAGVGRERERNIDWLRLVCAPTRDWKNPQPRHVPWPGIEPVTFWFTGWRSSHSSYTSQGSTHVLLNSHSKLLVGKLRIVG